MTPTSGPGPTPALTNARTHAAALFAAAGRNEQAGRTAQLHCLAAAGALAVPSGPVPGLTDGSAPEVLITQALRILGELDLVDFAEPDVLKAARLGGRALRGLR